MSACGTSAYKLSKFLKNCQKYTGKDLSFVKDSKGLDESLKRKTTNPDEIIVSFDFSALFASIPVPVALEVINRKITTHFKRKDYRPSWNTPIAFPRQNYWSPGNCVKQMCTLIPIQVLQATSRSSNGFSSLTSHSKYLHGIF